ncbi:hypothetical protein H0H81_007319 [Sphagnurus paluster]|uniref:DUF6699 domain-containing protein n=1 Tax=Sphagnurus paluster TaxID=117069 RepID=A0A9P7K8R6_9AGAR|nr:hypothetical protein H0H81_007319 [Sphagnurus paluster]
MSSTSSDRRRPSSVRFSSTNTVISDGMRSPSSQAPMSSFSFSPDTALSNPSLWTPITSSNPLIQVSSPNVGFNASRHSPPPATPYLSSIPLPSVDTADQDTHDAAHVPPSRAHLAAQYPSPGHLPGVVRLDAPHAGLAPPPTTSWGVTHHSPGIPIPRAFRDEPLYSPQTPPRNDVRPTAHQTSYAAAPSMARVAQPVDIASRDPTTSPISSWSSPSPSQPAPNAISLHRNLRFCMTTLVFDMDLEPLRDPYSPRNDARDCEASSPGCREMIIRCVDLPWSIVVRAPPGTKYLTIFAVHKGIYDSLRQPASDAELALEPRERRDEINRRWAARGGSSRQRIDWLRSVPLNSPQKPYGRPFLGLTENRQTGEFVLHVSIMFLLFSLFRLSRPSANTELLR